MIKIKQSKQAEIRRKLVQSGISKPEQFEEIISNLINQRERLKADLNLLRQKVISLQQKQAQREVSRNIRKRPSATKNQTNYRQQLNKKYEELKHWQKLSLKAMKNTRVQIQYKAFLDKVSWLELQIQTALRELNDEYIINKRLRKALKSSTKDEKNSTDIQGNIELENQNLKKRIFALKKITNQQTNQEIYLHDYLIEIKEKERVQQRRLQTRQKRPSVDLRKNSMSRIKTQAARSSRLYSQTNFADEIIDILTFSGHNISTQDIRQLQSQLAKWEDSIVNNRLKVEGHSNQLSKNEKRPGSKLTSYNQSQKILEKIKKNLQQLRELNQRRKKLNLEEISQKKSQNLVVKNKSGTHKKQLTGQLGDNAHIEASNFNRSRIHSLAIDKHLSSLNVTHQSYNSYPSQTSCTEYFDIVSLRKEFIGEINQSAIFDRNLLKEEEHTSIKALQIYYSDRGIATIKAIYNIHKRNTVMHSLLTLPEQFISNYCKVHIIDTTSDDFIRYFKVRYHTLENRITQIKIVTHKNIKNGWGDSKIKGEDRQIDEEIQKQIVFDINQDQYPVSIFCSHVQKGPYWYLCGFGVQINDL